MSEVGSVDQAEPGGGSYFTVLREQSRLRREIVTAVRTAMRGRSSADIAGALERALGAAGLVHPPEEIQLWTGVIANARPPMLQFARMGARAFMTRQAPAGMKLKRRELAGERWLPVRVAPHEAWAYAAMAHYHQAFQRVKLEGVFNAVGPTARLVEVRQMAAGGSPVAVLLGTSFCGTIESAIPSLLSQVRAAWADGTQLSAPARIERAGPAWAMSLGVPREGADD